MNKQALLILALASGVCVAMELNVQDATGAREALKAGVVQLRKLTLEADRVRATESKLENEYDKKSKEWKREIKGSTDRLISQIRLSNLANIQVNRQGFVNEALQKIVTLFRQIEDAQRKSAEYQEMYNLERKTSGQCTAELRATGQRLRNLASTSKENKQQIEAQVSLLQTSYEKLKKDEEAIKRQSQAQLQEYANQEKLLRKQFESERAQAVKVETALAAETEQLLKMTEQVTGKTKEIEKLRSNIELLENRLSGQRRRADSNWHKIKELESKLELQRQQSQQGWFASMLSYFRRGKTAAE